MNLDAWLVLLLAARTGGRQKWRALLEQRGSAEAVLTLTAADLESAGLPATAIQRLSRPDDDVLGRWRDWLAAPHQTLVPLGSRHYPRLLGEVPDAPLALWLKGAREALLNAPQIAIVGSRNPTRGGSATAEAFARYLGARGLTITSGLAIGIDSAGHLGALDGSGSTVAVLGSGLNHIFPRSNVKLARQISENGVLVSEYPPETPARAAHFPQRNRIIAGMSVGTLVVEATRRSGSLITARLAGEYGREVFAIPGSIHNPLTRGCHQLIRQGAKLVEEAGDVLVELAPLLQLADPAPDSSRSGIANDVEAADPHYGQLLDSLGFEPTTLAELSERTGLTAAELSSMLLLLELEGYVEALPGARYSRLPKGTP